MNILVGAALYQYLLKDNAATGSFIFYDRIRSGAMGTAATRASISTTYQIAQRAQELVAIRPTAIPSATIAAKAYIAEFDIAGQNYSYQPQNVFGQIGAANLGAITAPAMNANDWYRVYAPVKAGDSYDWGVTPQQAIAANGRAFVDLMYSSTPPSEPVIYSVQSGINTLTAATTGDIPGTSITATGAIDLVEVAGYVAPDGVQVAGDTLVTDLTFQSDGLQPLQQLRMGCWSQPPGVGASFNGVIPDVMHELQMGLTFNSANPIVKLTANADSAITNGGIFNAVVRYHKSKNAGQ
jgi:hypothetical protein